MPRGRAHEEPASWLEPVAGRLSACGGAGAPVGPS